MASLKLATSISGTSDALDRSLPPDVARDLIVNGLDHPTVFRNTIDHWPCRNWNMDKWAEMWGTKLLRFRVGPIQSNNSGPLWEADCDYVEATVADFVRWQADTGNGRTSAIKNDSGNGFSEVDPSTSWIYADYKHLAEIFEENHEIHQTMDWGPFGFVERRGEASTVWMGSASSHTPCHYDTYGFNLVAQMVGRKQWILFAPTDTQNLYPTRIPYEESSVFSRVDITNPDLKKFPKFQFSTPHIVTLEPGDVLFVPHKWWHFVSSLDTSISINSWIETGTDDDCRFEEAVTRTLMSSLMKTYPLTSIEWLNPTEEDVPPDANLRYVWKSLDRCLKRTKTTGISAGTHGQTRNDSDNHARSPQAKRPRQQELCNTPTDLTEVTKRYENIIRVVTPSTYERLMEEAALKRTSREPIENLESTASSGISTCERTDKEDRSRVTLINAIVDPEVVSLICEKFKRSILSESP